MLRAAEGTANMDDVSLLRTKVRDGGVVGAEVASFNDAEHIFPSNEAAGN